jgi:hypothetical protein
MSFGKTSAPKAPDYSGLVQASEDQAQKEFDLGQEQLDFYKDQYNTYLPYVTDYLTSTTKTSDENRDRANEYYDYYKSEYKPLETKFVDQVNDYASPTRTATKAGAAEADVANQYEASRKSALSSLESYGIDPSQTRYGALDLSSRVAQARDTAAAGTKSRLNTEAVGLGLEGEAIKTGRGYAPDVSGAYDTATKAGSSGVNATTSYLGTSDSAQGTPTSYLNSGNTSLSNASSAQSSGYSGALSEYNADYKSSSDTSKGIGSLLGSALPYLL